MKKLFILLVVASLALTIQAQDITNTLGTAGSFYINDVNDNEIIKVDASGTFHFKNEVSGLSTQFDLYNAGHNLKINFLKAKGTPSSPIAIEDGNTLGIINFQGYTGSNYLVGAEISSQVSGTVNGLIIPTDLIFRTQHTGTLTDRMTIKSDGKVGIGTDTPTSTLDVAGSMELPLTLENANYTITDTDYTIVVAGSSRTITLPTPVQGRIYVIKNGSTADNTIIDATTGKSIDGHQTHTLAVAFDYIMLQAVGTSQWIIISKN